MADAQDLKSWDLKKSCGFNSRHRHQRFLGFRSNSERRFAIRDSLNQPGLSFAPFASAPLLHFCDCNRQEARSKTTSHAGAAKLNLPCWDDRQDACPTFRLQTVFVQPSVI